MSDEKTEDPTDKKLRDARDDGEVPKSADITIAAVLLCMCMMMSVGGEFFADRLHAMLVVGMDIPAIENDNFNLYRAMGKIVLEGLAIVGPMVLAVVVCAIVGTMAQTGVIISFKPVEPKMDSINPASGLKRIFSLRSLIDLIKMVFKALLIGATLWITLKLLLPMIMGAIYEPLPDIIQVSWSAIIRLLMVGCILYLLVGGADYGIQRWLFMRDHKMSKDEVKREHKDSEGDPLIRSQRRAVAREMVESASPAAVGKANVVVVNPTHYSVAIRYVEGETGIPVVIAKGVDNDAFNIRSWAMEKGVPIVANPPLARALYQVPVHSTIPEDFFETVAAVLKWVDHIGARQPDAMDDPAGTSSHHSS